MARAAVALPLLALLASCTGTFSLLRPADTLGAGQVELGAGVAVGGTGGGSQVVGSGRVHVGLTDALELGAQYEEFSAFGELRLGILSSERHGIALAVGLGGGAIWSWHAEGFWPFQPLVVHWSTAGMAVLDATIGRRWGRLEVYVGDRFFAISPDASDWTSINALKAGVRFTPLRHFVVGLEGGATLRGGSLWVGEGTLSIGLTFGGTARPRPQSPAPSPSPHQPPPASSPATLPAPRGPAVSPGDLAL